MKNLESPPPHFYGRDQSPCPSPLKPMLLVESRRGESELEELRRLHEDDLALKKRIRRLRIILRILTFLISVAVFIPITMTLQKFFQTRDVYRMVTMPDGQKQLRTAWAIESKVWPTYMYFSIAAASVLLHLAILLGYLRSIKAANKTDKVASIFNWFIMAGNVVVWLVAVILYRTEKDKNHKSNDLWAWTCSSAAESIQHVFDKEINFNQFCNIQSASWVVGIVQVGTTILSLVIYILTYQRAKSRRRLKTLRSNEGDYQEVSQ